MRSQDKLDTSHNIQLHYSIIVTYGAQVPLINQYKPWNLWSREVTWQTKKLYLYYHNIYLRVMTYCEESSPPYKFEWLFSEVVFRGHATNLILNTKLGKVLTYCEKLPRLKMESCKLCNNKYIIVSTQITNTEVFASIAVLVLSYWAVKCCL